MSLRSDAALALAGLLLTSCSLSVTANDGCESSADCQAAFGFGSICGGDGLCVDAPVHPRCTQTLPANLFQDRAANANRVVFGNLMDRSLGTHQARERAAELAYRQANDSDGIADRPVGAVFCTIEEDFMGDGMDRATAAVAMATYLTEELGVPAILGPAASSDTQAVFTEVRDSGVLVISPSATSPALTDIDVTNPTDENPGRLWRTAPPDSIQGAVIAEDMEAREIGSVAVIYVTGAYGEGLFGEFSREFAGDAEPFPFTNATERDSAVATVGAGSFEEVLFIASQVTDASAFLNAAAALSGYDAKGIFLTDGAANADFLSMTRSASARYPQVRGTRPAVPAGLVYDSFVASYAATYPGEDVTQFSFTAHSYDAAWMLVYGAGWALTQGGGTVDGITIARGLRELSDGTAFEVRPINLQGIVNAFMEGRSVNIQGASGQLDYDPGTEETRAPIDVWTVSADGSTIVVDRTVQP